MTAHDGKDVEEGREAKRTQIIIDPRVGSVELKPYFEALGLSCELRKMESSDFAFEGYTRRGKGWIGIERKRLRDAINSMISGRFAGHQLIELGRECDHWFLIIEGVWRPSSNGSLEEITRNGWRQVYHGRRALMFRDLDNWLNSIAILSGTHVLYSANPQGTAQRVHNLYWWFQKPWDKHQSLHVLYKSPPRLIPIEKPSLLRQVASLLPGIGWEKSYWVERKWKSVTEMCLALPEEWQEIPGVGPKISERAYMALNGEDGDQS